MLPSKRPKQTFLIKKCHESKVGDQIVQEYEIKEEPTIKYEVDSDVEFEYDILATGSELQHAGLQMTCSDSDDSLDASNEDCSKSQTINTTEQRPQTTERKVVASTNNSAIPPKEPTIANVLSILTTVSEHIKDMQTKTEAIQKEVASISNRLTRVEKKVGISLATVEQMKDVIVTSDALTFDKGPDNPATNRFELKAVSNETEFTELDTKLGADEEYYAKVKRWLVMHINSDEPEKRMVLAMDLVFERTFMPLCSWSGSGKGVPKIAFRERTNILKLFADVGSNQYITVNELFVQKFFLKKLPHAKDRINVGSKKYPLGINLKFPKS